MGTEGAGQILVALGMSHTEVQHLIEKCLLFNMTKEECMEALSKHADIKPVITSTVWKELEKENKEFFEAYAKTNKEDIGIMSERETTEKIRKILSSSSSSSSSTPSSPRLRSVAGSQHHGRENDDG